MLSLELIVNQTEFVRERLRARGEEPPLDRILELDQQRRALISEGDHLRARRNEVSRSVGQSGGKPSAELITEMRSVGNRLKELDAELKEVQIALEDLRLPLPNLPLADVPVGPDESANVVTRQVGTPEETSFPVEAHWDSGPRLQIMNMEAGARMSGARFYVLSGAGARLQRALGSWMLDVHVFEHDYREIAPPFMVRRETMTGSGNLPKFEDNLYHDTEEDLWLIPTAEVALNYLHVGEILEPDTLPLKYVARTPCFRKEQTAAGRDTRGIKRVHQFEKVEMFRFVEPGESGRALDEMIQEACEICEHLGFVYRVVQLCTGDIGFQSAKTFDIEVWAPGSKEWLEVSSLSTCVDFQARRTNTRYRLAVGTSPQYPHTLNGSGLAIPRVLIALLENGAQEDGSVVIPEVLHPYTRSTKIEPV